MPDSFFELHIQVYSVNGPYFDTPIHCGPYISYVEAASVMMDGLHIVLSCHMSAISNQLENPTVYSKIVERALLDDGRIEDLGTKSEEVRSL